jgi:hypothetical protein
MSRFESVITANATYANATSMAVTISVVRLPAGFLAVFVVNP